MEAISIASGLLALSAFAFESCVSLYQVLRCFQGNQKNVRGLVRELEALNGVLRPLQQTVATDAASVAGLNHPLFNCGKACKDFEALIIKCTRHSGRARTSVRIEPSYSL